MYYFNCLIFLLLLVNWFKPLSLFSNPYIAIGSVYYIFMYVPGYYLLKYILRIKEFTALEIIPLSLCIGYALFTLFSYFGYIFRMQLSLFILYYLIIIGIVLLLVKFHYASKPAVQFEKIKINSSPLAIVVLLVIISFIMADYYGGFVSGNFLMHVSSIRKLYELNIVEYHSCYFSDFTHLLNAYCSYYVFTAAMSYISRLDPVHIWIYLPQFILPVGLITFFCLAKRLFKSEFWAMIFLCLYFVHRLLYNHQPPAEGYAWFHSEGSACNNFLGIGIFLPLVMIIILQYQQTGTKMLLFLLSLFFVTEGSVHLYSQFKTYFVVGSVFVWALLIRPDFIDRKKLFNSVLWSFSLGFILFLYLFFVLSPTINPAYKVCNGTGGGCQILFFANKWPLVAPLPTIFLNPVMIAGLIGFLVSIFLVKKDISAFYIFSIYFTTCFILFNPVVLYIGGIANPAYERITRIYNILPVELAAVFPFMYAFDKTRMKTVLSSAFARILLVCGGIYLLVFFVQQVPPRLEKIQFTKAYSLEQIKKNEQLYSLIREKIPSGSTVMVNLPLTTWWTTYFSHYIVAHTFDFILPPNIDQRPRQDDVKFFYASELSDKSIEILKKYNVNYIFILQNEFANKKFEKYKVFEPVFTADQFRIYKVNL